MARNLLRLNYFLFSSGLPASSSRLVGASNPPLILLSLKSPFRVAGNPTSSLYYLVLWLRNYDSFPQSKSVAPDRHCWSAILITHDLALCHAPLALGKRSCWLGILPPALSDTFLQHGHQQAYC